MRRTGPFILLIAWIFISCNTTKFSVKEKRIITGTYINMIMPLKLVFNKNDSVSLSKVSKNIKVDTGDKNLLKLVDLMYHTCIDPSNPGVGIAAPQIGINRRIIWVQRFDKENEPFEVYFNTKIQNYSEIKKEGWEGCLSVPGYRGLVFRSDTVILKYDTFNNKNVIDTITGFTSVIFQHEIDHLNGIIYTERIVDKSKLMTKEDFNRNGN